MKHKTFGYYEIGTELLIPITNEKAAAVRVERAGKKGCLDCYLLGINVNTCALFPCMPGQRADKQKTILKKIGDVNICG